MTAAALGHMQIYLAACQALGYRTPELTDRRIAAWYADEDALDLTALAADSAALESVAAAAEAALSVQRDALATLTEAWRGGGGSAAVDFIERHCAAAAIVATALHDSADALGMLRDRLAQLMAAKADATVRIDDRRVAERPGWLLAAGAVVAGSMDGAALDVVDQQILPFVDNDIRVDWIGAMRLATDSVTAAYDETVNRLTDRPAAHFEMSAPPAISAVPHPGPGPGVPGIPTVPGVPTAPAVPVAPVIPGVPPAPGGALPALPDLGGALGGLIASIASILQDAGARAAGARSDTFAETKTAEHLDGTDEDPKPESVPAVKTIAPESKSATTVLPPRAVADKPVAVPVAPPLPVAVPVAPPLPVAAAGEPTPCEIAADELPQVGG